VSHSPESLLKRVEDMESQLAFQDEIIDSLNTVVARQDVEIRELKRLFDEVSKRLRDIGEIGGGAQAQHEIPPHY
jgi:SlyX protein